MDRAEGDRCTPSRPRPPWPISILVIGAERKNPLGEGRVQWGFTPCGRGTLGNHKVRGEGAKDCREWRKMMMGDCQ